MMPPTFGHIVLSLFRAGDIGRLNDTKRPARSSRSRLRRVRGGSPCPPQPSSCRIRRGHRRSETHTRPHAPGNRRITPDWADGLVHPTRDVGDRSRDTHRRQPNSRLRMGHGHAHGAPALPVGWATPAGSIATVLEHLVRPCRIVPGLIRPLAGSLPAAYMCGASAPVAQLDRASDYGSEGWGFESSRARQGFQ